MNHFSSSKYSRNQSSMFRIHNVTTSIHEVIGNDMLSTHCKIGHSKGKSFFKAIPLSINTTWETHQQKPNKPPMVRQLLIAFVRLLIAFDTML